MGECEKCSNEYKTQDAQLMERCSQVARDIGAIHDAVPILMKFVKQECDSLSCAIRVLIMELEEVEKRADEDGERLLDQITTLKDLLSKQERSS